MLAYFHSASGGAAPLSLDWNVIPNDALGMTAEQIAYLRSLKAEVLRQGLLQFPRTFLYVLILIKSRSLIGGHQKGIDVRD